MYLHTFRISRALNFLQTPGFCSQGVACFRSTGPRRSMCNLVLKTKSRLNSSSTQGSIFCLCFCTRMRSGVQGWVGMNDVLLELYAAELLIDQCLREELGIQRCRFVLPGRSGNPKTLTKCVSSVQSPELRLQLCVLYAFTCSTRDVGFLGSTVRVECLWDTQTPKTERRRPTHPGSSSCDQQSGALECRDAS